MAATMLVCKQCNFENEPERVYCHNCGAKLDRSLLPPEATKREDPVLVQQRVRKMVKPRNATLAFQLKNLLYSVLLAAFLALIIAAIKPPGGTPNISQDAASEAPPIADDLDGLLQQPAPHRLAYSEDQVNAYLKATLRGGKADRAGALAMKFEQAYVHFGNGTCQITSVQSLFGLPIYTTTVRSFAVSNGVVDRGDEDVAELAAVHAGDLRGGTHGQPSMGETAARIQDARARCEAVQLLTATQPQPS